MAPSFSFEQLDRLLSAVEKIAENTAPKDKDLFEVTRERDQLKTIVASLTKSIDNFAYDLEIYMDDGNLQQRSVNIRKTIRAMHDWAARFKQA